MRHIGLRLIRDARQTAWTRDRLSLPVYRQECRAKTGSASMPAMTWLRAHRGQAVTMLIIILIAVVGALLLHSLNHPVTLTFHSG